MRVLLPAAAGALLLAACAPRTATPPSSNVVTITATDYAFAAPETIPAGLTTFKMLNQGKEPHQAVNMGASDHTFQELETGAMAASTSSPAWLVFPAGPGVVLGGDSSNATAQVAPGNSLILCFIASPDGKPHVMKGMSRRLVVVPAAAGAVAAAEPASDVTVTLSDYTFGLSAPLTAGTHTIRVENAGPQLHEIGIERLLPGKTLADQMHWIQGGMKGEPASLPIGGFVGPNPGKTGWVTVTLPPGKYLFTCMVPDVKDGKPHVAHGMVQEITIS